MQVSQDWKTFRWSRITLLSDAAAKLIRMMKVHVFSVYTSCVGVSHPNLSNNWATKWDEVWNEDGVDEKLDLTVREIQFIWHVPSSASTIDIANVFRVT